MSIYRPTELRALLSSLGIRPKKSLSQNFLVDGNIIDKILQLAEAAPGDSIIEIGPGPGAITEKLLQRGCHVTAIEKDRLFARLLEEKKHPQLVVTCQDVLDFDFAACGPGRRKVIANLPYHLTTPILERLFAFPDVIQSAVLVMQEEMARRCTTKVGTKECSSLTLFLHYHTTPQWGFLVSPTCFYPVPKVGSCVIRLDVGKRVTIADEEGFFRMTRSAFAQRRKMLTSSLRQLYGVGTIQEVLQALGLPLSSRPEELSMEQWIQLFTLLARLF